jgi:predicted helicase
MAIGRPRTKKTISNAKSRPSSTRGYPRDNIIFQAPERAVLYQAGARVADEDISKPDYLAQLVNHFFDYKAPHIEEWEQAVSEFSDRIPELAEAVKKIIDAERKHSPAFVRSFEDFYALCRQAINPNLSAEAVERMLIQHLLTERIFERIFDNPDFTRRNVVAAEIEKVIVELTKRAFNRNEFLRPLDRFYKAIEVSAENTTGFSEKQAFLNKVYERFFQGYSPKEADTHGIVYTPQPIVNFMVRSVEEILQKEFGRSLGDKGVHILDPFVGTGNFIVRIMQEIKATDLQYKYENELHCNEVMLLPYYIASMNIEHAYFDRTDEYRAFPGICLVDTFELAEAQQASLGFMNEQNAQRVKRQKESPIFVIIGNPPYNAWQVNENDNNRNRQYPVIDGRIAETYAKDSSASNKNSLWDPYVKAIRWASDRISDRGLVAFITNNGFIDNTAFDGMRYHLGDDFDLIYTVNLHGNIRKHSMVDGIPLGEKHTVFGLGAMVGIAASFFVRRGTENAHRISYAEVGFRSTRDEKFAYLDAAGSISGITWTQIRPDKRSNWLTSGLQPDFEEALPIGTPETKAGESEKAIFATYSLGVQTARDDWAYNFQREELNRNVRKFIDAYNSEVYRWASKSQGASLDDYLANSGSGIKWTSTLKQQLMGGRRAELEERGFRKCLYRPFATLNLYFDNFITHRRGHFRSILPTPKQETENRLICVPGLGSEKPFLALASDHLSDYHLSGPATTAQCFPFYTYAEDDTHRRENITDWALEQFRAHYHDTSITKWDIFHYIYAVLHHPEYRDRYAANLRRELPRIPFASRTTDCHPEAAESSASPRTPNEGLMQLADSTAAASECIRPSARKERGPQDDIGVFKAFVKAGERLAEIHVHYEQQPEYKLTKVEKVGEKLDYAVTKMKLGRDKSTLIYNNFLTLSGIPKETYDYRLGNRSALEWVIDQYQVSTDKRSGIINDPNRADDKGYILRLIGQVITVSLETVKIVESLPLLGLPSEALEA